MMFRATRFFWSCCGFLFLAVPWSVSGSPVGSVTLDSQERAAYQICLEYDFQVAYATLQEAARGASGSPLERVAGILGALGFKAEICNLAPQRFFRDKKMIVGMVANSGTVAIKPDDGTSLIFPYPGSGLAISSEELAGILSQGAVAVKKAPQKDKLPSGLALSPTVADFGIVEAGSIVKKSFTVSNLGKVPLILDAVRSSCGCLVAEAKLGEVQCGERREFELKFDSSTKWGYQEYYCYVTAGQDTAVFRLSGYVRRSAAMFPRECAFGITPQNRTVEKTVTFLGDVGTDMYPVVAVKAQPPLTAVVSHETDEGRKCQRSSVIIRLAPERLPRGIFESSVQVTYNVGNRTHEVAIPVSAIIVEQLKEQRVFLVRDPTSASLRIRSLILPEVLANDVSDFQVRERGGLQSLVVGATETGQLELIAEVNPSGSDFSETEAVFLVRRKGDTVMYRVFVIVPGDHGS